MIKVVCIQMVTSLLYGGFAVIVLNQKPTIVDFDVVHSEPMQVIVGGRGKHFSEAQCRTCEELILQFFEKQSSPISKGYFEVSA